MLRFHATHRLILFVPMLYYTFGHTDELGKQTLDKQGAGLATIYSFIILLGFAGACLRHALMLHFTSGLCTLGILFTGWAMFSSGFGTVEKQTESTFNDAKIGLGKMDPTTGIMWTGSFCVIFLFLGSVLHGVHGHRVHNQEGGMCGRKGRDGSYQQGSGAKSTELTNPRV